MLDHQDSISCQFFAHFVRNAFSANSGKANVVHKIVIKSYLNERKMFSVGL